MTLVFLSAYDSMNYVLAACAEEARRNRHRIIVVVNSEKDSRNNKMYVKKGMDVIPVEQFDYSLLDSVDMAISAPVRMLGFDRIFAEVRKRDIFLVSFASLFSSVVMREYPDLVLCLGKDKFREFRENHLKYNLIATGNPQYDALVENRRIGNEEITDVLIIDQGGYPYGRTGKKQLADTLVAIARFHTEKEFYIKPRYGDREQGRMTHGISEQLVDYIEEAPQNLHVLDGSEILEEILVSYDAMITTWSTAYIDAIMLNIPLILIGGMESMDVFDVRKQRVKAAYDHLAGTGCLYSFRELQERRTEFQYVSEEYAEAEIYNHQVPCAGRIIQLLEFIHRMLLSNGLRISDHVEADLGGFYRLFSSYRLVKADSRAMSIRRSYLEQFNRLMQEWVYINRCMGRVLELSPLYGLFDAKFSEEDQEVAGMYLERAEALFRDVQSACFHDPSVLKQVDRDRILQDFYFDWLYETRQYGVLLNYEGALMAPESRLYNMALFELDQKNRKKAYAYLAQFLVLLEKKETSVVELLKDRRLPRKLAPFCKGRNIGYFVLFSMKGENRRRLIRLIRQRLGGVFLMKTCIQVLKHKLLG